MYVAYGGGGGTCGSGLGAEALGGGGLVIMVREWESGMEVMEMWELEELWILMPAWEH